MTNLFVTGQILHAMKIYSLRDANPNQYGKAAICGLHEGGMAHWSQTMLCMLSVEELANIYEWAMNALSEDWLTINLKQFAITTLFVRRLF
mmetsp:Transcript_35138/g.71971  ORF Transcript_35138/g.71971 Transcript_35138/m.71971 type:complete len:91 (+) Transcript_35138:45-317(+)